MRRSGLQKKILFHLSENRPPATITKLAEAIGVLRPAASRSLKLLAEQNLLTGWLLTEKGKAEVNSFFVSATDIVWSYGDLYISFHCSCGEEVDMSQEEDENIKTCDCGRVYRFTCAVEVNKGD